MQAYTIDEVARVVGVNRNTLLYHHTTRGLEEPERVGTRRFYSEQDLARVKAYFAGRKLYERKHKKETVQS